MIQKQYQRKSRYARFSWTFLRISGTYILCTQPPSSPCEGPTATSLPVLTYDGADGLEASVTRGSYTPETKIITKLLGKAKFRSHRTVSESQVNICTCPSKSFLNCVATWPSIPGG